MPVAFKRAVTPRRYLEVAEMELRGLPSVADEDVSRNRGPTSVFILVFLGSDRGPSECAAVPQNPGPVFPRLSWWFRFPLAGRRFRLFLLHHRSFRTL